MADQKKTNLLVIELRQAIYEATYGYRYKREKIFELLDKLLAEDTPQQQA